MVIAKLFYAAGSGDPQPLLHLLEGIFWFPGTRHILKGEYPVKAGLVIGPEPVGMIH